LIIVAGSYLDLHQNDIIIKQARRYAAHYLQGSRQTRSKIKRAQKNHRQACGFFAAGCDFKLKNQVSACTPLKPGT